MPAAGVFDDVICEGFFSAEGAFNSRTKTKKQLVKAWQGISIRDLAVAMEKSTDHVFECIFTTDYADVYNSPSQSRLDCKYQLVFSGSYTGVDCHANLQPTLNVI